MTITARRAIRFIVTVLVCTAVALPAAARPTDGPQDPGRAGYTVPPSDVASTCAEMLCVHWVTDASNEDAPPLADNDSSGVPDWVEITSLFSQIAWLTYVEEFGFRAPLSDGAAENSGPDGGLDIYLANLDSRSELGFCRSDDPRDANVNPDSSYRHWDAAVYCVLDNDFAGAPSPVDALKVTAAHELFHAVQCAYDCYEDAWLAEGTAVYMEGRVFPESVDPARYREDSPLADPTHPLDLATFDHAYGAWFFWDHFAGALADPPETAIRRLWEQAADSPDAPRQHSLKAAKAVAREAGTAFARVVASFGAASFPRLVTDRGVTTQRLGRNGRTAATPSLDHLTQRYYRFKAGGKVPDRARLRLTFDLPRTARGSVATITRVSADGRSKTLRHVDLGRDGDGRTRVAGFGTARYVLVTLTNASTRMDCNYETSLACGGYPRDDGAAYHLAAKVVR